jgi:hypothetical protein
VDVHLHLVQQQIVSCRSKVVAYVVIDIASLCLVAHRCFSKGHARSLQKDLQLVVTGKGGVQVQGEVVGQLMLTYEFSDW